MKPNVSGMEKLTVGFLFVAMLAALPQSAWPQDMGSSTGAAGGGVPGVSGPVGGTAGAPGTSFGTGIAGSYAAPGSNLGAGLGATQPGSVAGAVNGMFPPGNPGLGTNISSGQIQSLLSSPEAQAILNNPAALGALAQKFGISPGDVQNIRNQVGNGGTLSQDQLTQLVGRLGGIQASPAEVASIANALGLNPQQIAQIQNAMAAKSQQNPQNPLLPAQTQQGAPLLQQSSAIEDKFRGMDLPGQLPQAPDLSQLSQYGYSLFAQGVSTFAPVSNVPVGDDYVVGPGDQLQVLQWGRINQTLSLQVDRDGSIQVPQVGVMQVGGLTFAQAKKLLESRLNKIEGTQSDVTMGQLRTIQVFVVGAVGQPGAYTVSSLSRISNVLQHAGGISRVGSLRRVELKRHNQRIDVLDLYDLLLRGDSSRDLRLENNDVIFVPVIGKVVAVAGDVKMPAIYELNGSPNIKQVLDMAGGVTAFGYSEHLQVERVQDHQRTVVLDINLDQLKSRRFAIRDGDLIKVYAVLPEHTNVVKLTGNVHRSGEYQWYSGMRVSDLLRLGQGLLPHTYFSYALIKRMSGAQKYIHFVPVQLGAALSGGEDSLADLTLQRQDELQIFNQDELRDLPHVTIVGEVRNPGDYPLTEQMRLSDLIYQAGGLKDDANKNHAELARTQVGANSETYHTYMSVNLVPVLTGDRGRDILLKNNDQVFVKLATDWQLPESVKIAGRVARPGPYVIRPGERLASALLRCGGLLPDAFPQGIVLLRESVQKLEQQRIDQARARLSQQLAQYTLTLPLMSGQNSNSNGGLGGAAAGLAALQQLLATASNEQADGRVVVHFTNLDSLAGSPNDVVLDDHDSITIPKRPSSVNVLGQVNTPTSIVAQPGFTVAAYLYRAGGPTKNGDLSQLMLIEADGTVITEEGLEHGPRESLFPLLSITSGGIMERTVEAGDTIYVPDNLEDIPSYLRLTETKDITTIISQSVMSMAVLGILAAQL